LLFTADLSGFVSCDQLYTRLFVLRKLVAPVRCANGGRIPFINENAALGAAAASGVCLSYKAVF
jgi:hypothetical protein